MATVFLSLLCNFMVLSHFLAETNMVFKLTYSGDLNNGLGWYSGHEHLSYHQMVHYSNGVVNRGQNCWLFRSWLE